MPENTEAKRQWLDRLLGERPSRRGAGETAGGTGTRPVGPKVAFAQARLRYAAARQHVTGEIDKLVAALRDHFRGEPDFATIDAAIQEFFTIPEKLDERLIDALDAAAQATTPDAEATLRRQALTIVGEYQTFLASKNRMLSHLDDNPVVPIQVAGFLSKTLSDLAAQLG